MTNFLVKNEKKKRRKCPKKCQKKKNAVKAKLKINQQGRIQTTSTYANAEVTSSVVKLSKNTGILIFSTKLLSSFLLPIEEIRKFQPEGLPWLFCSSCRTSLHVRHAVKTVCSQNIRKPSISSRKPLRILTIPHLCLSNACRVEQNTRAEQITEHVARQLY